MRALPHREFRSTVILLIGLDWVSLMPVRICLVALALGGAGIGSCTSTPEMENRWVYACPDGSNFIATYAKDSETVLIEAQEFTATLSRAEAASGAKYGTAETIFWSKGSMAMLELQGEPVHRDCQGDSY